MDEIKIIKKYIYVFLLLYFVFYLSSYKSDNEDRNIRQKYKTQLSVKLDRTSQMIY